MSKARTVQSRLGTRFARGVMGVATLVGAAASGAAGQTVAMQSPLRQIDGGVPGLTTAIELDPAGYQSLKGVSEVLLTNFVLGPDRTVDLVLERFDVFATDAKVVVGTEEGDVSAERPDVVLLRGHIADEPDSTVFLGLSPFGINGRIQAADGHHLISSGPFGGDQPAVVYNMNALPEGALNWRAFVCSAEELVGPIRPRRMVAANNGGSASRGGLPCRIATIAIDSDWEYTQVFGGQTAPAAAYMATLIGAISEIYTADANIRLEVNYVRTWANSNDPWFDNAYNRLFEFQDHWNSQMNHISRNAAHFLSGLRDGSTGGVAYVDALCWDEWSYGLSSFIDGHFPYPLQDHHEDNWDLMVVAHELGHNFGSPHTHDFEFNPRIDRCGSGVCSDAHLGTIMSYCHTCSGGMTNIALTLHPRVVNEQILPYLTIDAPCNMVASSPQIASGPANQSVCEGEPASFTVTTTGSGPFSYQWRLNGADIPGATSATYSIASAGPGDVGNYSCQVSNACGSAVSGSASLDLQVCLADLNGDCELDLADFSTFRAFYLQSSPLADFNDDGQLTVADFSAFRAAYLSGCQ